MLGCIYKEIVYIAEKNFEFSSYYHTRLLGIRQEKGGERTGIFARCAFAGKTKLFLLSLLQRFARACKRTAPSSEGAKNRRAYFLRKDLQSVQDSMVGLVSWVPTRMRSREQKLASSQW
jgi:hypothetical protein